MGIPRRTVIKSAASLAASIGLGLSGRASARPAGKPWDLIVVGGGNAGLPAAIFAAARGARVLIIDAAAQLGGTLYLSTGQMSAAGTKLQKSKGIIDSPQSHYDDIMRISGNTADPQLVRLAVDNAAAAFDWLTDHGFAALPEHPITGTTHDAWGREGGLSILKELQAQLQPQIDSGRVQLLLKTAVTRLLQARDGNVRGVEVKTSDGTITEQLGTNTLLTSGGYTDNRALFEKYEGHRSYSRATYPYSQGAGYTLGEAAGGYVRGGQNHTPLFGAVLASADFPAPLRALVRNFPPDRPPYEIFVDRGGRRFIREDVPSHTAFEYALSRQPDERCWVVFDEAIFNAAPPLAGKFGGKLTQQELRKLFDSGAPFFYRSNGIAELARLAGVDAKGLDATIHEYNRAQATGQDELGRKHMPLPIAAAPYYAMRLQSWNLTSYAGLAVDARLRVIRRNGTPIRNLYAAGELLGMGQLMGHSVCGGMSVMPALALGRLFGKDILPLRA
jgi:fumarate reductase flavoprotein subunit